MHSKATTVAQYLAELPPERRAAIAAVRDVIRRHLDKGYAEGMTYGMIGYFVPHTVYPKGYHCDPKQPLPFAGLASQKASMSLYLMGCYLMPEETERLRQAFAAAGKRLDMGKSCIRFKSVEDLPLPAIGEAIRRLPVQRYIARYEHVLAGSKSSAKPPAKATKETKAAKAASAKPAANAPGSAKGAPATPAKGSSARAKRIGASMAAGRRTTARPAMKPAQKAAAKPAKKPAVKGVGSPTRKPAPKPAAKSGASSARTRAAQTARRPTAKPVRKPTASSARKPAASARRARGAAR